MAWYTVDGEPVRVGEVTLTPRARVLSARFGNHAWFTWQTPTSVLVEGGGTTQRLNIVNTTLIAQVALGLLVFLLRSVR
jgi:hypothetical protein